MTIGARAMIICTSILIGISTSAKADLVLCNRTKDTVDVAIAYVRPVGGIVSEGWHKLAPCGACRTLITSRHTSDLKNYFYYAQRRGGTWSGSDSFCVNPKSRFSHINTRPCRIGVMKGFVHVQAPSGNAKRNLTSERNSCGTIID